MKQLLSIFACCLLIKIAHGQSTTGITGIPDTSYSVSSEYSKLVKTYPGISIVNELHSNSVIEKRDIIYNNAGGRKLLLDAFYPTKKNNSKKVAILIIHGGGWRSGNKTLHHPLAERLAGLGYVCFTPEYRLSTEALYPAAVYDIKAALRWINRNAKKYNIDDSKIVVAGHSAGGELAAFTAATNGNPTFEGNGDNSKYSSHADALIDMDGLLAFIHPESGEGDDSKRISAATNWFGYPKNDNPDLWKQASPLNHTGKNTPPTLFINSSVARMHAGREDYIKVLSLYNIYTEVKTFENAPHSFCLFNPWFDSTVTYIDNFLKKVFNIRPSLPITVAQDGSGDYKTVQEAFDAVPLKNKEKFTIIVKNGIYKEKLHLDSTKDFVTLMGEDKFHTILTYDDHTGKVSPTGDTINTRTSWSFLIKADNFTGINITFQNDAGFTAGQAVAVESDGDKAIFGDCRFLGNQDVLFTNNDKSRQYYDDCYIEGTTDFIFGSATVWFEKCHIYSKKNSHITAASTPPEKKFGFIFNECVLYGDTSLHNVSLGRPWRPYASVVYLRCYIGPHIRPEGWSNWNNTDNYKTARYAEYENHGPSADPSKRVNWSRQLTDEEAKIYTIKNIFGDWRPPR